MPDIGGPTVRHRRLAAELRRFRNRAGLTGDQVAEALRWSPSKVSRLEHGRTGYKLADVEALLRLYQVPQALRGDLLELARATYRKSWLESESASLPSRFTTYVSIETEARSLWSWEPHVVLGLLQTEDYARSIFEAWQTVVTMSPAEIERRVEIRLARQELLRRDPPLALAAVMDESVLTRQIGDAAVMRAQLAHLIECSHRPSTEIRILPLSGYHPITAGGFAYMQFAGTEDITFHDIVAIENLTSNYYLEDEDDTYPYRLAFQRLTEESLDPRNSRDVIEKRAKELWNQ